MIPVPTVVGPPVPTLAPSDTVPATPFRLMYVLTDLTQPSDSQYAAAADIALMNIEAYVRDQFSNAFGVEVDVFTGTVTGMGFD